MKKIITIAILFASTIGFSQSQIVEYDSIGLKYSIIKYSVNTPNDTIQYDTLTSLLNPLSYNLYYQGVIDTVQKVNFYVPWGASSVPTSDYISILNNYAGIIDDNTDSVKILIDVIQSATFASSIQYSWINKGLIENDNGFDIRLGEMIDSVNLNIQTWNPSINGNPPYWSYDRMISYTIDLKNDNRYVNIGDTKLEIMFSNFLDNGPSVSYPSFSSANLLPHIFFSQLYFIDNRTSQLGINKTKSTNIFNLYPNPASNNIQIKTTTNLPISIYNLMGELIATKTTTNNVVNFNISNLPAGVYIATDGKTHQKFIKE